MSKKSIGVGVISLGWMGRLHTRSFKALQEKYPEIEVDIKLVVCCDVVESNRQFAVDNLGFEKAVEDYRDVLSDPEVDVVSICAPNSLHHEIAMATIEAGKPFWIEKPMGISARESKEIARGAQSAGLITSVGFNYRHAPAIEMARAIVADGAIGRITNARVWLIADYASSPDGPLTWRYAKEKAGAGVILDLLGHGADLVQYVLKDRFTAVTAQTGLFITERPIPLEQGMGHATVQVSDQKGLVGNEDYVAVLGTLESGTLVTMESSRVSVGPRAEYIIEVYGTDGSLRWNFEDLNRLQICIGNDHGFQQGYVDAMTGPDYPGFSRFQPGAGTSMGFDDLKVVEAAQFIQGVLDNKQYGPSAGDGWAAAEVDDAIEKSAADRTWHEVAPVDAVTTFDQDGVVHL
ncbi:MAG: Gfo/Idh/MocA family oxidoreductase [Actinomyces sp.]|nr:Gfo/Idh/MocA family oxidoreductase [Actinomyces sp.]